MSDILVVDDEKDIRELISDILEDEGYSTRLAGNSDDAMKAVRSKPPGLLILDIWLKDSQMDGIDILKAVKTEYPEVPVVIISGHGNVEIAVAAIKQGAYDFIEKPFNIDQLLVVIRRAMETSRLRRENIELKRKDSVDFDMLGSSAAFRSLQLQLDKVTKSNGRVMLTGPSGCGKETAARYVHSQSNRAQAPFVSVGCAAIDPEQFEITLFGHESPEHGVRPGLLEEASGGVIYFDEIADLPLATQPKLLRVLVDQQFMRVGGSSKVKVDLRVISSTSKDIPEEVSSGRFREELYHRLNVVPIAVPSLDERREDIPEIVTHFVERIGREQGLGVRQVSADALALMQTMAWPGNLRQLKNLIERLLILGDEESEITAQELSSGDTQETQSERKIVLPSVMAALPLREAREEFEREYLLTQINRFGGNISRTAQFVGMERSALHRKLKSLNVVTSSKSGARVAKHADQDE